MKFLIIDDEPLIRRSISRALRARQHEVFEAENGEKGLKIWNEKKPDLVFLDVLMPIMSGTEVLNRLKIENSNTKIILMTAYTGEKIISEEQLKKVNLFVQKPFEDIFELIKKAERLVKGVND